MTNKTSDRCIHIYIYICVCARVSLHMCGYICGVCVYVYIYIYMCVCVYCMILYVYVCVYVYVSVYVPPGRECRPKDDHVTNSFVTNSLGFIQGLFRVCLRFI